ncbi:EUKARYOTIC TRANSLATION INITIATION FACTOR 4 GAMMA [Salix viminalis]|uniref:Eukaryotic translation initiation factor 4G n=1 Tax=Salix viminalis TaxID=40686 RepID=A0A9Q0ZCZ3_SALVM|nr:EUKARYOTIC TRANSLATION INITIATION FACTOR 4 GAMMA [Salix viminalis]
MSYNQSRGGSDKSELHYRKSGRSVSFNQQRASSVSHGKGGAPPVPSPSSASLSSNRSFNKKPGNLTPGGVQSSRVNLPPAVVSSIPGNNAASTTRNVKNGALTQHSSHGTSDASSVAKPTEAPAAQRSTGAVPKAPPSQPAAISSENGASKTPAKAPVDSSKAFAFQFGSISPGFMNGMQVPARTSSAPPKLDEQKRDQTHHDTFRPAPPLPTPTPKQQLPRKEVSSSDQTSSGEVHLVPKASKETQFLPAPSVSQTQKPSVLPIPITSLQMKYQQPPVSVQFCGPSPQIQSQGVSANSLHVPIHLPMGNAPQVQQSVFIQGLQHHPMQPQGMMHQGQSMNFTNPMGPQIPQLGSLAIGMTSQYSTQQGGKFGSQRKTPVKITDPKTHEELRLDKRTDAYSDAGSSGLRSHLNVPQSQPIPSFAPSHPINYYPNSYNAGNLFFPAPSSLPLTGSQIAPNSQPPPRFNYPVSQPPQNVPYMNASALNLLPLSKSGIASHGVAEPQSSDRARDARNAMSLTPSGAVQVTVKPAVGSHGEKVVEPSLPKISSIAEKGGFLKSSRSSGEASPSHSQRDSEASSESKSGGELLVKPLQVEAKQPAAAAAVDGAASASLAQSEEAIPNVSDAEGQKKEAMSGSNSIKEHQKKPDKKGNIQLQHQIGGQTTLLTSLSSHTLEHGVSSGTGVSEENKKSLLSSANSEVLTKSIKEPVSTTAAWNPDVSEIKVDNAGDAIDSVSSQVPVAGIAHTTHISPHAKLDDSSLQEKLKCAIPAKEEQREKPLSECPKQDYNISSAPVNSKPADLVKQEEEVSDSMVTSVGNEVPASETAQEALVEPVTCHTAYDHISDNPVASASRKFDSEDDRKPSDASLSHSDNIGNKEASVTKSGISGQQDSPPVPDLSEATAKHEGEGAENAGIGTVPLEVSGSKEKRAELTRSKSTTIRLKKKKKEFLLKADLAGTTSDLYGAYKGPEEKKENVFSSEVIESTSSNLKQAPADALQFQTVVIEKSMQNAEPDDWEDVTDTSTPKLESLIDGELSLGGLGQHDTDGNVNSFKKYSRDFLLKFSEQCTDLPGGFEITPDIADLLIGINVSHLADHDPYPSPSKSIDRSNSGSRIDRRGSGIADDGRWSKQPGPFGHGRDLHFDIGYGANVGFRPVAAGNYGVLRNPRAQSPAQYGGGILPGPMQSMGPQGGLQRGGLDADRWQRSASIFHRGPIPSPPSQPMHKAEKKYEVGKVVDEEAAKQRKLKGILNKLTPQNFEKLFEQVKAVNIDNVVTLTGVISQIFDKALTEPTFCEMYANFCFHLASELPELTKDDEKVTFKRLLLNKCQEEFERGEREQEEADKADEEGEIKQSEEEREEKRIKARRQMLGNIRLIGELYKKKMLTERIMHSCIKKLLGQYQNPDEEDIEALCKLMSTIGEMIDHPIAKEHMDAYFDMMAKLSNNMKLSSRVRFMLKDSIDLRRNRWQQRRKVEGPKKIEEVHRDAAQERQLQSSRLARNPGINPSPRRGPMDFGPRGSTMLPSPNAQMGGFRGFPTQVRGHGTQDFRFEDRQSYEARTLSVPLTQRPLGGDSITLGPQGGLARGMSMRGQSASTGTQVADISPSPGDPRRMAAGLNGFSAISDRSNYSPREDLIPRYATDRFAVPPDQMSGQERNRNHVNRDLRNLDHGFDRPLGPSPPTRAEGPPFSESTPTGKLWPEERLRDMSMATIKEFYSARDEKEVALCIKDLNSPSFHPSMISLWVTDSFERKDMERNLLAKLLVSLASSQNGILDSNQLIKGFESVLSTLEDAVNDAPKAPEFLGRIIGRVVVENVAPLSEIGQLLREGGEEPGSLLKCGLAGDVLGSILEVIEVEKGEGVLNEIRGASNLRLEDFRPPDTNRY